ncbi:MAG: hypothetical protein HKN34_01390 [Gammaproteobacteria bacterium]|nr:hypothetical protein [Gammaproteobacteria bacterium]
MKRIFWIIVFVFISLSFARGDEGEVTTYVQYKTGSPIILHLNYYGGIKEWDAGASIANGKLILSNAMFISITNSKNERAKPIKDKVLSVWADKYFRNPFNLVLDISRFYDLSQPDKYIVQWGCKDVKFNSVFIKIVD